MRSSPAIALYLGESYASLGVFDLSQQKIYEKSVFLPQVSFKNLLTQIKLTHEEFFKTHEKVDFYLVTKYLDRLKNYRLGGSVAQVVMAGFENSYSAMSSKALSLAASSLVISIDPAHLTEDFLGEELLRIKKINPDVNKVVIQLSEQKIDIKLQQMVFHFFEKAEFKIFKCAQPENLGEVRKSLLNAGTEGTKEEILSDIKDVFGDQSLIQFWTRDGFKNQFENYELFSSSGHFLSELARAESCDFAFYLDHENFRVLTAQSKDLWDSPWGMIPCEHHEHNTIQPHPFSEVHLDQLSILNISTRMAQYEPGPMIAGRGLKPLVIDLFQEELVKIEMMNSIFSHLNNKNHQQKLKSHLSVIEKGQQQSLFSTTSVEIKTKILNQLASQLQRLQSDNAVFVTGPLAHLLTEKKIPFSWPDLIIKKVAHEI